MRILQQVTGGRQGSIRDEYVDRPGLLEQPVDIGEVGEISSHDAGAELLGQRREDLDPPPAEHELGPFGGQCPGNGLADAAGRTRDERAGALDFESGHHEPFGSLVRECRCAG